MCACGRACTRRAVCGGPPTAGGCPCESSILPTCASSSGCGGRPSSDGGTLLLDDVGDLSPDAQARLARFLHRGTLTQLGSSTEVRADVRIISTTNRDLRTLIGESLFREDLYYRLNVVEIDVPGLAKRPEDIAELARSFLDRLTADNRKEPLELGGDALAVLQAYPWPGNVRQLKNVLEGAAVLADDTEIQVEDLSANTAPQPGRSEEGQTDWFAYARLEDFRGATEKEFLRRKLLEFGGNIKRTAENIELQRSNLYKKLDRYGLK